MTLKVRIFKSAYFWKYVFLKVRIFEDMVYDFESTYF